MHINIKIYTLAHIYAYAILPHRRREISITLKILTECLGGFRLHRRKFYGWVELWKLLGKKWQDKIWWCRIWKRFFLCVCKESDRKMLRSLIVWRIIIWVRNQIRWSIQWMVKSELKLMLFRIVLKEISIKEMHMKSDPFSRASYIVIIILTCNNWKQTKIIFNSLCLQRYWLNFLGLWVIIFYYYFMCNVCMNAYVWCIACLKMYV